MLFQLAIFSNSAASSAAIPAFTVSSLMDAVLKILFVIGALLYLVFAFIVVRQIQVMKSTLVTPLSPVIQLLGFLHLLFALGVVILFVVTL